MHSPTLDQLLRSVDQHTGLVIEHLKETGVLKPKVLPRGFEMSGDGAYTIELPQKEA